MYQGSAVACAMFITGQASNLLGANLALKLANVEVTAPSWFAAAIVPGLLSCLVVPWITYRVLRPEVTYTPEAPTFARAELQKMGPLTRPEWITLLVFATSAFCGSRRSFTGSTSRWSRLPAWPSCW